MLRSTERRVGREEDRVGVERPKSHSGGHVLMGNAIAERAKGIQGVVEDQVLFDMVARGGKQVLHPLQDRAFRVRDAFDNLVTIRFK